MSRKLRRTLRSKRGSGKLGEGMTGKVHYPALECDEPSQQPKGDYVSKLTSIEAGDSEFKKTEPLRSLKPTNSIYPESKCIHKGKNLLFLKYGGFSLSDYFTNLEQNVTGRLSWAPEPVPVDLTELNAIIAAVEELVNEINVLNKANLYHNDVSLDNIVFNPKTKKAYLIDFERMTTDSQSSKRSDLNAIQDIVTDFKKYQSLLADKELKVKSQE
jgi:hypothetical protein